MGLGKAQANAFRKGTTAALQRQKDQEHILVDIALADHLSAYTAIEVVKSALYQPGGLNPATSPIRMVESHADAAVLIHELEAKLKDALAKNVDLSRKYEAVQAAGSIPPEPPAAPAEKWVSVAKAAEIHQVSDQKIRRAIRDGHIRYRGERVNKYTHHQVIAESYTKPPRKKRGPNKKKTP